MCRLFDCLPDLEQSRSPVPAKGGRKMNPREVEAIKLAVRELNAKINVSFGVRRVGG